MKLKIWTTFLLLLLFACTPAKQEIAYGFDACAFCKMTIVDKQHAAESISDKGRVYKFDAIECLLDHKIKNKESIAFSLFFVNCFDEPGVLFPAETSSFLISKKLPSPMGAYLTAFSSIENLDSNLIDFPGKKYNWIELQAHRNQLSQ